VISLALDNNRDLRVAMLDIDKARAQYRIQRAALLPAVDATGQLDRGRVSDAGSETGHSQVTRNYDAQIGTSSWEIDLFGRLRSLKREQLETWLATGETQRGVRLSLVGEVASDWLAVANAQRQLELARQTLASQEATLKLVAYRHDDGIASGLDLAQVQTSVESARADVAASPPCWRRPSMPCNWSWARRWTSRCCPAPVISMPASRWRRCRRICRLPCCCDALTCWPPSMR
jgi:multidrug efflux system outer membrane protein